MKDLKMIMEENNLQIQSPFGYVFGQDFIKEDLSELKSISLIAKGLEQGSYASSFGENPFFILKKYKHSEKILTKYFNKFAKLFYNFDLKFKITTSWAVKLNRGDSVHHHNHRNCLWSGVYYYGNYTDKSCPLYFQNPISQSIPFAIDDVSKRNPMISDIAIQPQTNMVIFFPSWIYHYSNPNMEDTRYSLAFNLMPSDEIGGGDSTYHPSMMIEKQSSKGFA